MKKTFLKKKKKLSHMPNIDSLTILNKEQEAVTALMEESYEVPEMKESLHKFINNLDTKNNSQIQQKNSETSRKKRNGGQNRGSGKMEKYGEHEIRRKVKTETKFILGDNDKLSMLETLDSMKKKKSKIQVKVLNINEKIAFSQQRKVQFKPSTNMTKTFKLKEELKQKKSIEPYQRKKIDKVKIKTFLYKNHLSNIFIKEDSDKPKQKQKNRIFSALRRPQNHYEAIVKKERKYSLANSDMIQINKMMIF